MTPGMDFSAWHIGPIMIGNFINAVVSFLILAACVFALVKGMNALMLKKEEAPPPRRRPRPAKRKCCLPKSATFWRRRNKTPSPYKTRYPRRMLHIPAGVIYNKKRAAQPEMTVQRVFSDGARDET